MTAVVYYLFMTGAESLFYWLLMEFINLTGTISNRACCNSSAFELCPSYTKFLAWHRLMSFDGSWMFSRERGIYFPFYITWLYLFYISVLYFLIISHFAFFHFNQQQVQLGTWPWTLKFQENFRAGKKVYIDIFRCFAQT